MTTRIKPMKITVEQRAFLQSIKKLLDEHSDNREQIVKLRIKQTEIKDRIVAQTGSLSYQELSQLDRLCCRIDEALYLFTVSDEGHLEFERLDEVVLQDNRAPWE